MTYQSNPVRPALVLPAFVLLHDRFNAGDAFGLEDGVREGVAEGFPFCLGRLMLRLRRGVCWCGVVWFVHVAGA